MKKVQLERMLESLEPVPEPRADTEQYPTPAGIAAEVAFIAHAKGDLEDRRVLDAGCGNGTLAIAAKLLGAGEVVGVDVDPAAVEVAERNAERAKVSIEWRVAEISTVSGAFDTVLMNPPFGAQTKHADLPFLDKALSIAKVVYSFHNAVTVPFLVHRIVSRDASVTDRLPYDFPIRHTFPFHRDEVRRVPVVLLRTVTAKG